MHQVLRPRFPIVPPAAAGWCSGFCWPLRWLRRLRPRDQDRLHDRHEAPDRTGDQPAGPQHRPRRRPAELHRERTSGTSVFPKLTAYIEKWNVDIGDKVKKGDTLATLFVPELVEDFGTKKATVELDEQRIELAKKMVKVAEADVKAAKASLDQARAILDKFKAEVERWDIGGQAAQARGRKGRGRPADPSSNRQSVEVKHRRSRGGQGDHREGRGGIALRKSHARKGERSTSRSPEPISPWPQSEAKRIKAWVGYSSSPPRSTA